LTSEYLGFIGGHLASISIHLSPTQEDIMRGRKPVVRPGNASSDSLTVPEWLNADAKKEWDRVAPTLAKKGILKATDRAALASYCIAYARLAEAERIIDRDGQVIQDPIINRNGEIIGHRTKKHPAVQSAKDYAAHMLRASALFGMNPQDRQRVAPDANTPKSWNERLTEMGF
jgi:P27 family predicted phage terminase small subunit